MTDETLADKRRRQSNRAIERDDHWLATVLRLDAAAIETRDARIAELKQDRDQTNESWHYASGVAELAMKHRDEAEAKCKRFLTAARADIKRAFNNCEQCDYVDPLCDQCPLHYITSVANVVGDMEVDTALAADQQPDPSVCAKNAHTGEAADQQGEREDEDTTP